MAPHSLNSNVFPQHIVNDAWKLIKSASKITLLTHFSPDGDGISACAALDSLLTGMGKKVETVYPSKPELPYTRQPGNVLIKNHTMVPDLLIACDTSNYERLYFPPTFSTVPLINIDHHISNSIKGTYNLIDPNVSSTCELLYLLLLAWAPDAIDFYIAECLLFGILYDSQVFHIQSTKAETLRIAADLMDKGSNLFELKNELLTHKNPAIIRLWGNLLSTLTILPEKKTVIATISQKELQHFGLDTPVLVGFNNFLAQITDIDITIILYETHAGQTRGSLRSKKADVNALAAQFGGGGHKNAAGILSTLPLAELTKKLIAAL